jgi:hypothetical protein
MQGWSKTILWAIVLFSLTGCGAQGPAGISALSEPSLAPAQLPAHVQAPKEMGGNIVLLAEKSDYAFYAADEVSGGACAVVVSTVDDSDWVVGCGGPPPSDMKGAGLGPVVSVGGPGSVRAKLTRDGYDASSELAYGWEFLHPNLLVIGL